MAVDERTIAALEGEGDALLAVSFTDGTRRACDGLLVGVTLHQRSALADQLGATAAAGGLVAVDPVVVDSMFATVVPGLFAAGDLSSPMPSVANAIAAGAGAAAAVVHSILGEDHHLSPPGSVGGNESTHGHDEALRRHGTDADHLPGTSRLDPCG